MTLGEKSMDYASQSSEKFISQTIQKAFEDGYKAGYEDGRNSIPVDNLDDGYVDLGLPSGTLWAKDYVVNENDEYEMLNYNDAIKYSLPTLEQLEELVANCSFDYIRLHDVDLDKGYLKIKITGPNKNFIELLAQGIWGEKEHKVFFWIKSKSVKGHVLVATGQFISFYSQTMKIGDLDRRERLCVLQVKNKQ